MNTSISLHNIYCVIVISISYLYQIYSLLHYFVCINQIQIETFYHRNAMSYELHLKTVIAQLLCNIRNTPPADTLWKLLYQLINANFRWQNWNRIFFGLRKFKMRITFVRLYCILGQILWSKRISLIIVLYSLLGLRILRHHIRHHIFTHTLYFLSFQCKRKAGRSWNWL